MVNKNHNLIDKACEFIKDNLHKKIILEHLVSHTGYSERSIQLIFQKHFKLTPFEYIEEQRLLKAFALIKERSTNALKVSDIANEVGLNHLGRFSVKFKSRFSISPSDFKKSIASQQSNFS